MVLRLVITTNNMMNFVVQYTFVKYTPAKTPVTLALAGNPVL
jgi:hypothetical protein